MRIILFRESFFAYKRSVEKGKYLLPWSIRRSTGLVFVSAVVTGCFGIWLVAKCLLRHCLLLSMFIALNRLVNLMIDFSVDSRAYALCKLINVCFVHTRLRIIVRLLIDCFVFLCRWRSIQHPLCVRSILTFFFVSLFSSCCIISRPVKIWCTPPQWQRTMSIEETIQQCRNKQKLRFERA